MATTMAFAFGPAADAAIVGVDVQIENLSPTGGVAITPVWVGFHNGNFDLYNSGAAAGRAVEGLERVAEDGNTSPLASDFRNGFTYVDGTGANSRVTATGSTAGRIEGTIGFPSGPPPIQPGQSTTQRFSVDNNGANDFFSYASMVIPSNDFFLANGSATAIDLSAILDASSGSVTFLIGIPGTINDAGTELEDFNSSAANGLFGLTGGQSGPNEGAADPNAFIRDVTGDPFADFANIPTGADLARFNFNDAGLYSGGGIARITITAVPEPTGLGVLGLGLVGLVLRRQKRPA